MFRSSVSGVNVKEFQASSGPSLSRRTLLVVGLHAGAGLSLGWLPGCTAAVPGAGAASEPLLGYLRVTPENRVTLVTPAAELGQGVFSTLAKILADELGADWDQVRVEQPTGDQRFANPVKGRQSTGGSDAVRGYYPMLRHIGATAREMLTSAAAARWEVSPAECHAKDSQIVHMASGRRLSFGEVAAAAAELEVPEAPALRPDAELTLIGHSTPRKDVPAKVDGSAVFADDLQFPGVLSATVRACPVFGGQVAKLSDARALAVPGVLKTVAVDNGSGTAAVAVIANGYWEARRGAEALDIEWDPNGNDTWNSERIRADLAAALEQPGRVSPGARGDVDTALAEAPRTHEAIYEVPFLAHTCMEPMSATAWIDGKTCRVWAPCQQQGAARDLAQALTGFATESVVFHSTFAGGGFGRKWELDFVRQAVQVAMAMPGRPVKLIWSRETDIQQDYYRPAYRAHLRAGLAPDGRPTAVLARIAGQSIMSFQGRPLPIPDPTAASALISPAYDIPAARIEYAETRSPVPVGFWRAVSLSQNGFFAESFIDEMAHEAGADPLAYRRMLLQARPRELAVLDAVAEMAGWGRDMAPGTGLGIALTIGFEGITAEVAEVAVNGDTLQVVKIWCAHDCGAVVDPDNVVAQMEGGIAHGLSATLYEQIDIAEGAVVQSNFTDYPMLRMREMPDVEVALVHSDAPMGGAGESSLPPLAAAVTNAIFAATGRRIRTLPLSASGLRAGPVRS
jgi:isoquinoline 1-oxidoreductase beta subunit